MISSMAYSVSGYVPHRTLHEGKLIPDITTERERLEPLDEMESLLW
jgi:hypothetical protein